MKTYNITMIGSGSTYTPELIDGLIQYRDVLPVGDLKLMDIDDRKRTIVGDLCRRILEKAEMPCKLTITDNLDEALTGADFVITQIRVGKLPARVLDETIPLKYNLIGQETTGIGGFFKALRTVPVILGIAKRMEVLCPNAFLINFTNPAGIVTQALSDHSSIKAIGLCNVPINMVSNLQKQLGAEEVEAEYVGLNHLSWITKAVVGGKDETKRMIEEKMTAAPMKNITASGFSKECIAAVQGIPSSYMEYFYNRNKKLEDQLAAEKCRGEICIEIEEKLLIDYADPNLCTKPEGLDKRGGAKYSMAAVGLIDSLANDRQDVQIVNVRNGGALPFMDDNDVVEIPCIIDKNGPKPIPVKNFANRHIIGLMRVVKEYENHAVKAAMTGSKEEALRAMLIHPLIGDSENARACFEELQAAHKQWLPQFEG
jgi:6-phospho-beta-glucosidase